ncbi:MAG: M4 family metallopeptidase [Bacteroidetes bacterium]|nr:M4 family metallopeptidase [Bacteroidota bacterium]
MMHKIAKRILIITQKTIIVALFVSMSVISYSQEVVNKFTRPLNKDTNRLVNSLDAVIINNGVAVVQNTFLKPLYVDALKNQIIDTNIKVVYSKETSLPIFIEMNLIKETIKSQSIDTTKRIKSTSEVNSLSYNFLDELESITHISNPRQNLEILETNIESNGKSHIKFQQKYNGIKIYGSEFLIHLNANGEGELFNGSYSIFNDKIEVVPTLTIENAIKNLKVDLAKKTSLVEFNAFQLKLIGGNFITIDTIIYKNKLAYKIIYFANILDRYEYFIDANSGIILSSYNTTCTIDVPNITNSNDLNGVSQKINVTYTGSNYVLKDISKPMYNSTKGNGYIETFDFNNTYGKNQNADEIINTTNTWSPTQTSAHNNLSITYDFYKNVHNRNSIDGKGGNINSYVNVIVDSLGLPLDNAFWALNSMFFGNGYKQFKPLAGGLDVAAHEMTHGVVDNSAKLVYNGQSGALNESFADIFGAMVDSANWTIGEMVVNKAYYPSGALRSLMDPHNGGKSSNDNGWQPKHMNEYLSGTILDKYPDRDYEGVHVNSGIPNYAFFLFANAIGRLKASRVYYRALTTYLLPNSNFTDLRLIIIKASSDLYSSNEVLQAGLAFDAVGITDGVTPLIVKQLPVNTGVENMLLYGTGDTTLYIATPNLKSLWSKKLNNKPSITDDGKTAYLVGFDKKIYSITTDPTISQPTYSIIQSTPMWNNVSISKDGKRLAAVTTYQDSSIYVYDFGKTKWYRFKLYNPTYTNGIKKDGPIYADSFEWDYSSENIIYDCYNKIASTNSNAEIKYWDINIINVWNKAKDTTSSGVVSKVFNLGNGDNIGNPTFSKNSPDIFAFDYFNDSTKTNGIIGYNLQTNNLGGIFLNNTIGYPTFNKNDDKIAFNTITNSKLTIASLSLNTDKISSSGTIATLFNNAKFPIYYTVGVRKFAVPSKPNINITGNTNLCTGDSTILNSSATIGNQWYRNGSPIVNATGSMYSTKNAGNYMVLTNVDGISSSLSSGVYITTNITPLTPTLSRDASNNLVSTNTYGNTWYKDGLLVSDTTQKVKPTANGLYKIKTSLNGCTSGFSNQYFYLITDVVNLSVNEFIKLAPNPFYNQINIDFVIKGVQLLNIDVYNITSGAKVNSKLNINAGSQINFGQLSTGLYLFVVYTSDNKVRQNFKIFKL